MKRLACSFRNTPRHSSLNIFHHSIIIIVLGLWMITPVNAGVVYAQTLAAKDYKEGFKLEWSTSQEQGSEFFVVERAEDGIHYESIGVVKAQGDSDRLEKYDFNDLELGITTAYYRLKQFDKDGTSIFSASVEVKKFAPVNYVISGIKEKENIYIIFIESVAEGAISLSLQDMTGEELVRRKFLLERGLNEYQLNLESEKPGNYSLIAKRGMEFSIRNFEILKDPERNKDRVSSKDNNKGG